MYESVAIHFCSRPRCGARFHKPRLAPRKLYCSDHCRKRHKEEIAADAKRERGEMIPRASRESIVDQIQDWVRIHGDIPAATDWNPGQAIKLGHPEIARRFHEDACWPYVSTVLHHFGSWNAAIAAAGYTPRGVGHYTHYRIAEPTR